MTKVTKTSKITTTTALIIYWYFAKIDELIDCCDKDGSGSIDFEEFCLLMDKREKEKMTKNDIKQIFTVFDKVGYMIFGSVEST